MVDTRKITGDKRANPQPTREGRSESGDYTVIPYEGTTAEINQVAFLATLLPGATFDVQRSFGGGKDRLEIHVPMSLTQTEVPVDDWEFFAGESQIDLMNSDLPGIAALSDPDKDQLRSYIEDAKQVPNFSAGSTGDQIYRLVRTGVKDGILFLPTLRHTQTVSQAWTVRAALTNVRKIISTATLSLTETIPGTVLFNLPNDVSSRAGEGLWYGWLKKFPTVRKAARQKAQIEQEWAYGLWPTLLYNGNSGAPL